MKRGYWCWLLHGVAKVFGMVILIYKNTSDQIMENFLLESFLSYAKISI